MGVRRAAAIVAAVLGIVCGGGAASADAIADFYAGKKMNVVVGSATGGGYDTLARLMARHLGRFIPGGPTLVVQNMPGAASFLAANHVYNVAPKDGTTIGLVQRTILSANVTNQSGVRFDVQKFSWVGNLDSEVSFFLAWHTAPVKNAQDLFTTELVLGGGGPTSDSEVQARMLNALIGTKIKVVSGYPGQNQILLAMERGEVQGMGGWGWNNIQMHGDLMREGKINLLLQCALERLPQLPDLPTPFDFVKNDIDRKALELFYLQQTVARPVLAPPDVPADRLAVLRSAFMAMAQDEAFHKDAAKAKIEVAPSSYAEIEKVVDRISNTPPDVVARLAKVVTPPGG
ncbi:MAG: Bug family tripartite tricarboxylate transporter substrate binding protein [Gemmatimonas sp.]